MVGITRSTAIGWRALLLWAFLSGGAWAAGSSPDPAKVLGPDECGECHKEEVAVWRETHHAKTFLDMPREDDAREIADKMGLRRIRDDNLCADCHFTRKAGEGAHEVIAGVACESCHGAAADWNRIHSDFGGRDVTAENETPEHKAERLRAADAAGMVRKADLYALASQCFACHTVADEKLVNVGGHTAGSEFELVAWSQGEVRHNIWFSDGKRNREATPERKRVMFVLGKALDLEHALRAVAGARERDEYAVAMARRAQRAALGLQQIAETVPVAEVAEMVEVAGGVQLSLGNSEGLTAAADAIAAAARRFVAGQDGSGLAAIDPLLPTPDKYKGKPAG